MGLSAYDKKRNFKKTPEPAGKKTRSKTGLSFVVQRHKASHLHYDFRLEMDGVLKSWAVPKGPSLNPGDKRLAMMVEDHPFEYRKFAGIIPEGNYGAGIVEIWDQGFVSDIDRSDKKTAEKKLKAGLKAGNLKFTLSGKKLKGDFALVKLKGKQENAWLLIKHKDKYAVNEEYNSEEHTLKNSPINKWLRQNQKTATKKKSADQEVRESKPELKKKVHKYLPGETKKLHHFIKPMLAKETDRCFSDKDWIYEIKWDGYRAIAEVDGKNVSLYSRNGNTFNGSYPLVVDELKELNIHATIDGEIVVMDENGRSNFQSLQYYESDSSLPIEFRVFDVLSINGQNTCDLRLIERKKLLKQLLPKKNPIVKYSDHIESNGIDFFKAAVKNDLEGIMAKKADSLYSPGTRTGNWLKIKNHRSQEVIIAGFTEPAGSRDHFGALILALKDGDRLKYIGHTGSGFNAQTLDMLYRKLKPLIQKRSPFSETIRTNMPATWVKPVLVCEIKFTEWTKDGKMRHPIFLRLRNDKKPNEVTVRSATPIKKTAANKKSKSPSADENEKVISFGKTEVKTTNLNKVFWPKEKITKGDVINYYLSISKYILPYLKDRPQSLKRNPNGINDPGFFHKDAGHKAPSWVKSQNIFSESANKNIDYILCNDQATLTYLNNLGCIEINPWHSTVRSLDKPDYLIIDIDPSNKNTFDQVIETANAIHDVFKRASIESYCKTSGASGIHVYVPTQKKYTYDQLKDFAHLVCILTQEYLPKFTTLERNLKKRGDKMIYLDHLQNRRGQTISSVYSLRPKEGATVSMPLKWKEVKPGLSPQQFTIHNSLKRIQTTGDIFSAVLGKGIDLSKALRSLEK
jgi:bifunctional non-homologous end joining protein LigD